MARRMTLDSSPNVLESFLTRKGVLKLGVKASLVKVFGRVQRVGYRRHVLDSAQELGLSGYVRNEKDGSVTVFVQGDDAAVEKFIEKLKTPPQPAHVKSLEVKDARPRPALKYFTIKPSPLHEELQEGFGAMQSIFIDYWGEFRGFVGEFRGFVGEFRDYRQEFRDYRQEFRDFREEFRDYRNEFREFARRTDDNFKAIMEKYGEISEKLTTILETLTRESRETREMLNETMKLLREALEKLSR
jgi:acylphosphatase